VDPRVVRHVASPLVQSQREPKFKGIHPSGSRREEQPPRTVQRTMERENMDLEVVQTQRKLGFRRSMRSHSEPDIKEIQLDQKEIWSSKGSSPSGLNGRETSSRTHRQFHGLRR
jgi:hypothetical protein